MFRHAKPESVLTIGHSGSHYRLQRIPTGFTANCETPEQLAREMTMVEPSGRHDLPVICRIGRTVKYILLGNNVQAVDRMGLKAEYQIRDTTLNLACKTVLRTEYGQFRTTVIPVAIPSHSSAAMLSGSLSVHTRLKTDLNTSVNTRKPNVAFTSPPTGKKIKIP